MSQVRLTRRGRLLLRTFPLFLAVAVGVQSLANRPSAAARDPRPNAAVAPERPDARVRTPAPTPTHSPTPAPQAPAVTTGFDVAPGTSAVYGTGPLRRFTVEVEHGLPDEVEDVAEIVQRVLFDRRGWAGTGALSFQRVASGPVAFRVVLASPATTDRLCAPLQTGRIFSCYQRGRAVLNAMRWHQGAATYRGDLDGYRVYMVNHEVGHALGHGHRFSCGPGGLAYVMIQQTKDLLGCRRNTWPLLPER